MNIKLLLDKLDQKSSQIYVGAFGDSCGLSTFLFHGVHEENSNFTQMYPQEKLTVRLFEEFVERFLSFGYSFIRPEDILNGSLRTNQHYGLLTFDDGYFNNTWILDVLNKYEVPAVFFVPTALVVDQEKIWSDVIYKERLKQNVAVGKIAEEIIALNPMRVAAIKDYLSKEFGANSLKAQGDSERPLTPSELCEFAKNPFVHIGNHTHNHEVLKNLNRQETISELEQSQKILFDITGKKPDFISYPYGSYSATTLEVCHEMGFSLGITTKQEKNKLSIKLTNPLTLSRFNPLAINGAFDYNRVRSSFQFKTKLKQVLS